MDNRLYISSDVFNVVAALALSNARAMRWALEFGANARDMAIVKAAYEAALLDVAASFGLHRPNLVIIFNAKIEEEIGEIVSVGVGV